MNSVFFAVWAALVAGVLVALVNQDRFFAVDNKAVATLEKKSGGVQLRSEGLVRWREAVERQGIFDGDRVATSRDSSAKVAFGPGRALALGEDSQIQITGIMNSSNEYAFLITLLRGTLVAEVEGSCEGCPPLIIRAGEETFNVGSGNKLALFKEVGKKAQKFDPKGPRPIQKRARPPVTMVSEDFLKGLKAAPSPPPPPPPPPPSARAKGYEAEVRTPPTGLIYYTVLPMAGLSSQALEFPITPPAERPKSGEWRPVAEVSGAGSKVSEIVQTGSANDLSIRVPVVKARQVSTISQKGAYKEYAFTVRGGAQVTGKGSKKPVQSFSDNRLEVKIRSYGEFAGGPVTLAFDKLVAVSDQAPWIQPKGELKVDSAPIAVHMTSGQDYFKFLPYIRGAGAIGLSHQGLATSDGIFVVKNQAVVAQLTGSGLDQPAIEILLPLLDGNFVFKGSRSALYDMRGTSQTALLDWIGALLDKGKVLYILKRNKLYPVSRDFIKTNTEVAKFIDSQAKAIFLEKVEILDYR